MPARYRKLVRINLDGTAWVAADDGVEIPVQLVMAANGSIGAVVADAEDAIGIDQGPTPSPPPVQAQPSPSQSKPATDYFNVSGLDQT